MLVLLVLLALVLLVLLALEVPAEPLVLLLLLLLLLSPVLLLLLLALLRLHNVTIVHRRGFFDVLECLTCLSLSTEYACEENLVCPCAEHPFLRFEHFNSLSPEIGEAAAVWLVHCLGDRLVEPPPYFSQVVNFMSHRRHSLRCDAAGRKLEERLH